MFEFSRTWFMKNITFTSSYIKPERESVTMTSQSPRLPNLLPSGLQSQHPPLATRRFVHLQRRLLKRPQHPLELDRPVLDEPRPTVISSIPCRKRRDFSFLAPSGRMVAFPRPVLLPRILEFQLPPDYQNSPLQSPEASPRESSCAASPKVGSPNPRTGEMLSPAPSEESIPSYSDISSGPPSDDGYDNFVQPGLENEVYDDAVNFAARMNRLYKTAPWTSDPEACPCWSEDCPLWPMPHNLGLYFHYGKRPSEVLQDRLQEYGLPTIFEGGNPPEAIWDSLIDEYYGNGTGRSRSMLLRYRRYHCNATIQSQDVEDVLLSRGAQAMAARLRRGAEEAQQEEQRQRHAASIPNGNSENDDIQYEASTVSNELGGNNLDINEEDAPSTGSVNTSRRSAESGRETSLDSLTRQVTELTYWSGIPDQHTTFRNYGLLPPPWHQVEPRSFDNRYSGHQHRTPHEGCSRLLHHSLSPMMRTFLEDLGLAGIWGKSIPGLLVFHAFIRVVQHASPMEAADIRLVDRFRLEYVYGIRPLKARDSASVVREELWLDLGRRT